MKYKHIKHSCHGTSGARASNGVAIDGRRTPAGERTKECVCVRCACVSVSMCSPSSESGIRSDLFWLILYDAFPLSLSAPLKFPPLRLFSHYFLLFFLLNEVLQIFTANNINARTTKKKWNECETKTKMWFSMVFGLFFFSFFFELTTHGCDNRVPDEHGFLRRSRCCHHNKMKFQWRILNFRAVAANTH